MRVILVGFAVFAAAVQAQGGGSAWVAGRNFTVLEAPRSAIASAGKVEVLEAFAYTCGHCYDLEPKLSEWLKQAPDYVRFTRLPVVWNDRGRALARLHYTLEALGRADVESAVFETLHQDPDALFARDESDTYRQQLSFVLKHGIPEPAFATAYNSAGVRANVQRAEALTLSYRIESTPSMVINGKFSVTPQQARANLSGGGVAGDFGPLLAVTGDLAANESHTAKAVAKAQ